MNILHREELPLGGFAGLIEHQLVKTPSVFGFSANNDGSWSGIGNFVYLADAKFQPFGETHMHPHHEVDVISVMVDGRIKHRGSLGDGNLLLAEDVQVQRAGGEGFIHNEINPDETWNRMIQLWVLPEQQGQESDYKVYKPNMGKFVRIYGGNESVDFPARTKIDIGLFKKEQQIKFDGEFLAYLLVGKGIANNELVVEGDLFRGNSLSFEAQEEVRLLLINTEQ